MKSELKMQYLNLKLKISGMVARMHEYQGTLVQKQAELEDLQQKLSTKSEELAKSQRRLKELEKSFKKSDKIGKLVVSTDNTEASKAELKKKLDSYIVIIDHCIEQLRKP